MDRLGIPIARLRRIGAAFWIALLLVAGGQATLLHGLAHSLDRIAPQEQLPPEPACDLCLAAAPFTGALPSEPPAFHPAAFGAPLHAAAAPASAHAPPRVHFRSRAPPAALHA